MTRDTGGGRRACALAAALACLAFAGGCGGGDEDELPAGTFEIGYRPNATGPLAARDRSIVAGARIAVADVNRLGGVDRTLRLALVPRFEDVDAVLLPCAPELQTVPARAATRAAVVALAPCNADPTLADRVRGAWPVAVGANVQAARLAEHLHENGGTRAVVVVDNRVRYAVLLAGYFRAAAGRVGVAVSREVEIGGLRSRPDRLVRAVARDRPDILVAAVLPADAAWLASELRRQGLDTPLAGLDTVESAAVLESNAQALEGLTYTSFSFPEPGLETDELYEKYKAAVGRRPDGSAIVLGHDAVKVVEAAIDDAGSTSFQALLEVRAGLEVGGAVGKIAYPEGGDANPAAEVPVVAVEDGRLTMVENRAPEEAPPP